MFSDFQPAFGAPQPQTEKNDSNIPTNSISDDELLYMLGDEDYQLRQFAEAQLLKMPEEKLSSIISKYKDSDIEIKLRLERLSAQIKNYQLELKLSNFAQGKDKSIDKDIPYWTDFLRIVPNAENYRRQYASMLLNDTDLFFKTRPDETLETRIEQRVQKISMGMDSGIRYKCKNETSLMSLIFLTSIAKINQTSPAYHLTNNVINNNVNSTPNMKFDDPMTREIFSYWIVNAESIPVYSRFQLGQQKNLPGTIDLCRKLLKNQNQISMMHDLICFLARTGDDTVIPELVEYLNDKRVTNQSNTVINNKPVILKFEVRDIALACLVKKTRQSLAEYGFHNINENEISYINRYSTYFIDEESRSKASEKWKTWAKTHLNEKNQLIKKDTPETSSPKPAPANPGSPKKPDSDDNVIRTITVPAPRPVP